MRPARPGALDGDPGRQPNSNHDRLRQLGSVSTNLNFNGQTDEAFTFYRCLGTEFVGNGILPG